jgi:cation diffusion facilitator CzcD-associated flavoprotein CzcO|tara:strand:- start:454 stop:1035 length:582 start_codon:yes stop_codon:yes gene_type:complete
MVSYVLNVDKVGDLKFGRKKCRLHKKSEVVQVAKDYGIPTPNKKTVSDLCGRLKKKIKEGERVSREEVKKILANQNNIPLAKLYPQAAKKRAVAKKKVLTPSMKAALKKKAVTNFMKGMVTTNANIKKLRELNEKPKPSKKAKSLTKDEARKRIKAMKGLGANNKFLFVNKLNLNQQSPRRVVRMAREMARLR